MLFMFFLPDIKLRRENIDQNIIFGLEWLVTIPLILIGLVLFEAGWGQMWGIGWREIVGAQTGVYP